jgi:hypothetical protein
MTVKVNPYGSEATVIDNLQSGDSTSDLVGFYGKTPVAQITVTAIGTTTISQVATSGKWAFASSTAALAFVASVKSIQTALDTLGLVNK